MEDCGGNLKVKPPAELNLGASNFQNHYNTLLFSRSSSLSNNAYSGDSICTYVFAAAPLHRIYRLLCDDNLAWSDASIMQTKLYAQS